MRFQPGGGDQYPVTIRAGPSAAPASCSATRSAAARHAAGPAAAQAAATSPTTPCYKQPIPDFNGPDRRQRSVRRLAGDALMAPRDPQAPAATSMRDPRDRRRRRARLVGGYILSNQRFYLPAWVPFVGTDFFDVKAEFSDRARRSRRARARRCNIAGVKVGEIGEVDLKNGARGRQMKITGSTRRSTRTRPILLRPKTGLKDMTSSWTRARKSAGELPRSDDPGGQDAADVNPDEILAGLDGDTRDYLRLLDRRGRRRA